MEAFVLLDKSNTQHQRHPQLRAQFQHLCVYLKRIALALEQELLVLSLHCPIHDHVGIHDFHHDYNLYLLQVHHLGHKTVPVLEYHRGWVKFL